MSLVNQDNVVSDRGNGGLAAIWGRLVAPVPPALREAVRVQQADDVTKIIATVGWAGPVAALAASIAFDGEPHAMARWLLTAVFFVAYAGLFASRYWWRQQQTRSEALVKRYLFSVNALLVTIAVLWSFMICSASAVTTDNQSDFLFGIILLCMATTILMAPLSSGLSVWVPGTVGSMIALAAVATGPVGDVAHLYIMAVFAPFCGMALVYLNRRSTIYTVGMLQAAQGRDELAEKSELISLLLNDFEETSSDWLWETDANLCFKNVSPRFAQVCGKSPAELNGRSPREIIEVSVPPGIVPGASKYRPTDFMPARESFRDLIIQVKIGGTDRVWSMSGRPGYDKTGQFIGYHGVGSDITDQRQQQTQIEYLVHHDALTGLPNRMKVKETLAAACADSDERPCALLYLDLDHFKEINDQHGYAAGDVVLKEVAARLPACMDEDDLVARVNTDEFMVLLNTGDIDLVEAVAGRIVASLSAPFIASGEACRIGVSIGIVLVPKDGNQPDLLENHAEVAMRRAKTEGRGGWRFYDPDMDKRLQARRTMRADLQLALERQEFRIDFQPVIDLGRNQITGAEALLRWLHPVNGLMPPAEFIPLAEESGLIGPIGTWVLQEACKVAATWPTHIGIAVNLSPVQFRGGNLRDIVAQALTGAGLAPHRLELEITESTLLESSAGVVETLKALHDLGVRIALDDFGTGYSSLSYLRRFPFSKIKIDRSFVKELSADSDDSSIILAIIGLAERLKMTVTAEGVETTAQAELLNNYGCPLAQGYLFSRPVSQGKMDEIIAAEAAKAAQRGMFGALLH
jgi:diguanylate cyclase (GGDEF)-like protein/PAS domain S-box-containing protein